MSKKIYTYENRVVAYIDILGFKNLLNETIDYKTNKDNSEKIKIIIEAYEIIHDLLDESRLYKDMDLITSKKVSIFSDCIVVSFEVKEPSQLFHTLIHIRYLIVELVQRNILCRGAIVSGKMVHTESYLFGPALVEAYLLESKATLYPRVILDRSLIELCSKFSAVHNVQDKEFNEISSLLEQDSDGMYYIDYFYKVHEDFDEPSYDFPLYLENIKKIIQKGLQGSSHHSRVNIRVKYNWMREKYNLVIDKFFYKHEFLKKISPNKFKNDFKQ